MYKNLFSDYQDTFNLTLTFPYLKNFLVFFKYSVSTFHLDSVFKYRLYFSFNLQLSIIFPYWAA